MYFWQRSPPYNHVQLQATIASSNGIRHCSNNTFCTLFRKDFHFWFRYAVPLSFLNLHDICKNQQEVKLQQLIQF